MHPHQKALKHFKVADPKLHDLISKLPQIKTTSLKRSRFESLVEAIISQQLSVKASDTIYHRFLNLFPKKTLPTAEQILLLKDIDLRAVGLSHQKISYIKDLSSKVLTKQVRLHSLHKLENEEVILELTKVKGIGRWTAEMFLMFNLQREDVFSHGDLGLRNAIIKLYKFKNVPTETQVEKIVAKWSPHKTIASRYLWKSLDNEPLK